LLAAFQRQSPGNIDKAIEPMCARQECDVWQPSRVLALPIGEGEAA
jgi:hypothetical protein